MKAMLLVAYNDRTQVAAKSVEKTEAFKEVVKEKEENKTTSSVPKKKGRKKKDIEVN